MKFSSVQFFFTKCVVKFEKLEMGKQRKESCDKSRKEWGNAFSCIQRTKEFRNEAVYNQQVKTKCYVISFLPQGVKIICKKYCFKP